LFASKGLVSRCTDPICRSISAAYPADDGPHNDAWKELLPPCFRVVDEVVRERKVEFPVRIGGGSMLMRRYKHRKSRDLDLFVTDVQLVRWCSPRFNETAADLFLDYGEEAAAVKLVTGMQEIDIIAAALIILDGAVEEVELGGRTVLVELPREIVAKKVVYGGRNFQTRDVFDLACVATAEPEEIAAVLPGLTFGHLDDLDAHLKEMEPVLEKELADRDRKDLARSSRSEGRDPTVSETEPSCRVLSGRTHRRCKGMGRGEFPVRQDRKHFGSRKGQSSGGFVHDRWRGHDRG
jgi:Nucleotidyl transferase AbiEii toxin, Type IV TA system